ncbi:CDP-glycerol glycerophosphotransferase family protein [Mumia sp. ZJ1417]|uniref:bifunctional glycosyltransferase/CDP-glycerol:glycerophosphate glycerophosphotransferase n=1 Tax=Mumia sp. ZJ1417 TaxID=2708082 RepID=UPI00141FFB35|nr:bifunctional glycosyltransferase/CDP-glycerol:glycerophosphate glycerophosphotransferase [Mumia sp. ZJ1417]QMW65925.1 CDP-glycerol glycerophosphotransferase family protein [Mumia sp. ZJ1417]
MSTLIRKRALYRLLRSRLRRRSGRRAEPLLSVVLPVYNIERYLEPCIESILGQSFTRLELLVVDDGSTDRSPQIARRFAERDRRVRIVRKDNSGLGAARNTGLAHARARYVAFADSDDVVLPHAYRDMVRMLEKTGSDFVVGGFRRGDEERFHVPDWVQRVHASTRTGLTIEDHPEMLLDITAWNKVFRRSFWDATGLEFPEGVRYEDQVPMTEAFLRARTFDVLKSPVYLWRTRGDGSSITQQKATRADIRDRLASQTRSYDLVREHGSEVVRRAWLVKLFGYDFPGYFQAALIASDDYWELLREQMTRIRAEMSDDALAAVTVYPRMMSALLADGMREAAEDVFVFNQRHPSGWPTEERDGVRHVVAPLEAAGDVAPVLTMVTPADRHPRSRLVDAVWEGSTLVLRGFAFLMYVDDVDRALAVRLVDDVSGEVVEADVTPVEFPASELRPGREFEDHSRSGFMARIEVVDLVQRSRGPTVLWRIEVVQTYGGVTRAAGFTGLDNAGSVGVRPTRVVDGHAVRLHGTVSRGIAVRVAAHWAIATEVRSSGPGAMRLLIDSPVDDPVVGLHAETGEARIILERSGGIVVAAQLAAGAGEARPLRALHRSGASSPVVLGSGVELDGDPTVGTPLSLAGGRAVHVGRPAGAVLVDAVRAEEDALVVEGTAWGVSASTLQVMGPRAQTASASQLGQGKFSVRVPLVDDPWGTGDAPLPSNRYVLAVREDQETPVTLTAALRHALPAPMEAAGYRWQLSGRQNGVDLRPIALADDERGAFQQGRRQKAYTTRRSAERLDVVLFECFAGRTVGDSPLAICRALRERRPDLERVWSVEDRSAAVPAGTRAVVRWSREWYELLARAKYLVNNNNFPAFFAKAQGQVHLQTWHGTPLKRIGHDIHDAGLMSRSYMRMMDAEARSWDFLISPSPYCSQIFPDAFGYGGPLLEVGYPRNDVLLAPGRDDSRERVRKGLGLSPDQRVILYAPTWRENVRDGGRPAKALYLDVEAVVRQVPGAVVLVRGHANTAASASAARAGVVDVTLYPDVADLFLAADVLVTDYSSVMFDFAVLDRPIHLLAPDLDEYRDRVRGFYVDLEDVAPGPVHRETNSLIAALVDGDDARWAPRRSAFRDRFAPLDDGSAASRVVDAVFDSAGEGR